MRFRFLLAFLTISNLTYSQNEFVDVIELKVNSLQTQEVIFEKSASSLVFESKEDLAHLKVEINGAKVEIKFDPHINNENLNVSELIIQKESIEKIKISSKSDQKIKIYALHVPKLNNSLMSTSKALKLDSCKKPQSIDQSIWRNGLNPPAVNPSLNSVSHCIIHHSAGSNTSTDYLEVVRNIYVYHTSVNGWDDIGYNFLVAPDGTIFDGRDGMGQIEDDNVRGAHFCGKNTGTMGICLLGNFLFTAPTTQSLKSLEEVILWKLNKENLNPADSFRHPIPGGAFLDVISGHMDGCATDCPGTFLYSYISALKDSVINKIQFCNPPAQLNSDFQEIQTFLYPNPFQNTLSINSPNDGKLTISNLIGTRIASFTLKKGHSKIDLQNISDGNYILKIDFRDNSDFRRLIYKGN